VKNAILWIGRIPMGFPCFLEFVSYKK